MDHVLDLVATTQVHATLAQVLYGRIVGAWLALATGSFAGFYAFEFLGGTVNVKYLSALFMGDDGLDVDCGYTGKGQFLFVMEGPSGDRSMEIDSSIVSNLDVTPRSTLPAAAAAHANLASPSDSAKNRVSIFDAGSIASLLSLLEGAHADCMLIAL